MAQCCYDEDALFAWDFEDGAGILTYFTEMSGSVANTGGAGINGSRAAVAASSLDEFSRVYPESTDQCGNPRRAFALGGYWKVASLGDDFYIAEIRYDGVGTETAMSLYQSGPNLVVYNGQGGDPVLTVSNVFSTTEFRRIEMRGYLSTQSAEGGFNANADASVEVRINNRIYRNGDDFGAIDPQTPVDDPCDGGTSGFVTPVRFDGLGWDKITISPHYAVDCLYWKEVANYCNERDLGRPGGSVRCPEPGPGGSSFEGTASGQRSVQVGGFTPTYSQPTGGGRLTTASDPSDAQTMASITTPIVTLDITLPDATVKRYGFREVVRSGAAMAEARLIRVGDIPYPFSDRFGNLAAQLWEVQIADPDGALRAILASGANRYFKRWEGILYIENDAARLAGTARRKLARGRAVSVRVDDELSVTIVFSDEFSRHDSPYSLDRELPHVLVSDVFKPTLTATGMTMATPPTDDVLERATPILLGECSDERRITENPPVVPIGICPLLDVGDYTLADGKTWIGFLVCLYAVKSIPSLFASNLDPLCPSSVRADPDVFSNGEFLVPGQGSGALAYAAYFSTSYIDITTGGVTYRVTMVFGRGPRAQAHRDGKVPVSANVNGVEATGDTTGTMIDDAAFVAEFLLEHPIVRQTTTGSWGSPAAFADTTSKIRHSSFTAAETIHDARVSTGYKAALLMYERRSAREWLADLLVSADLRIGINHHGQVVASTLNDTATLTGLTTFSDGLHIRDGSFRITSELNAELENTVSWDAGPEPSSGRTSVAKETSTASVAVTNWGGTYKARDQRFMALYLASIARDVAGRRLLATLNGITRGEFDIDLTGGDLTHGQLIRSTDFRGLGTTGWTDRLIRVTERRAMVNPDELSFAVLWEDVHQQLVAPGTTTTSAIGFRPVGNAATGVAPGTVGGGWVVGNASDGTAWRVA